ncbi:MAG: hypothetical protein HN531_08345 [Opitutae bacterium]|jgi:hypothetical protein|nr:hypothetical protein [Opitutae bacterium]
MKAIEIYMKRIAFIVVIFVVIYINCTIVSQSRNVLLMDDWGTPGELFYSYYNGGIDASELLSQHNESRLVLTKIYSLILLNMGIYSTQIAVYIRIILSFVCCALIYNISRSEIKEYSLPFSCLILLIIFIPTQYYNMLFGMTFIGFIVPICILLSVIILFSEKSSFAKFSTITILSILSTFTYANGMILWFLCNPFIFNKLTDYNKHINKKYSYAFTIIGLVTIAFYFMDYIHPEVHPDISSGFSDPLRLLHFFAILIWAPFAMGWTNYLVSSVVLSFMLCYVAFHYKVYIVAIFRQRVQLTEFKYAMFLILVYGLVSCMAVAFGRCGFGLKFALAPQYPTVSIWIHIALIGLFFTVKYKNIKSLRDYSVICYILLYSLCFEFGINKIKEHGQKYKIAQLAIYYSEIIPQNPFLKVLHPKPEIGILPKIKTFKNNNLITVCKSQITSVNPIEINHVDGNFSYRSDGKNISFTGYSYNAHEKNFFDHLIMYDKNIEGDYKPLLSATFNKTNKSFSEKCNVDNKSLVAFDHSISFVHTFVDPILCAVDLDNSIIYKIVSN